MAARICDTCGAENDASERFCIVCGSYLWWDEPETVTAAASNQPTVAEPADVASGAWAVPPRPPAPPPPATVASDATAPAAPGPDGHDRHAQSPLVVVHTPEISLAPDGSATALFEVNNPSSIVDGYDIVPLEPPTWLSVDSEDAHLMPGETRQVAVRLTVAADQLVLAQRLSIPFAFTSQADASQRADVRTDLVVPPAGPRMSLIARPALIRLQDAAAGEFTLVLDNSASNHPQTFRLSASDPENAVRFAFDRTNVTVRPGAAEEMTVSFSSPMPDAGAEITRQLAVTGEHADGPVVASLTLVQRSRPAQIDAALRMQLRPAQVTSVDGADVDFDVTVDNRAGHRARSVVLSGRDPKNQLGFAFGPRELAVPAGTVGLARVRVRAPAPPAGDSETMPFTIVASDGHIDTEAEGTLEATSTPDPMTTAALHVEPQHVTLTGGNDADFSVDVDNRRGNRPLRVFLSGDSDDGLASLRFDPHDVVVAPQSIARVRLRVDAPRAPARQSITRQLSVEASDGRQTLTANAAITQTTGDARPVWSRILVILGVLLVGMGAFLPWFRLFDARLPSIELFVDVIASGQLAVTFPLLIEPAARVLVLVFAVMMAFGLTGKSGGLTRKSAVLIVLLTVGLVVFFIGAGGGGFVGPDIGLLLVWAGAVIGYIGGVLAKQR